MKPFLFLLFLISSPLFAEVIKFDITGYDRKLYSYKEVCKEMGGKHLLIIDVISPLELDCMGKRVSVKDFCLKKVDPEKFLRGYVSTKLKEVTCEMGEEALLSLACNKQDRRFCDKPQAGCEQLQKIYAHGHSLDHFSYNEKDVDDILSCYFARPVKLKQAKVKEVFEPFKEEDPIIDKDLFKFDKVQKDHSGRLNSK